MLATLADDQVALNAITSNRILAVDCCLECNGLLGSDYDQTIIHRRLRLRERLKHKYARLLETPDWTDYELAQLGPRLQQRVIVKLAQRDWLRQRLQYDGRATLHGYAVRPGR